jgi:hypothetical protein
LAAETSLFALRFDSRSLAATEAAISVSIGSRAASRRTGSGSMQAALSALTSASSRSADSISGRTGRKMPRSIISRTVGAGSGRASSFSTSSAIRSRDKAIRSLARAAQASSAGASGSPAPNRA